MTIPIIGNGDIFSPQFALEMKNKHGVDGLMVGRQAMGYPWIFREIKHYLNTGRILAQPDMEERVSICKTHLQDSIEWKGERRAIFEMRKFYGDYFKGIIGMKPYRVRLVALETFSEIEAVLDEIRDQLS
jgi:tRNA-dihydrouridine synthase B